MTRIAEKIINIGLILSIVWVSFIGQSFYNYYERQIVFVATLLLFMTLIFRNSFKRIISQKVNSLYWLYLLGLAFGILFAQNTQVAMNRGLWCIVLSVCAFFIFQYNFEENRCVGIMRIYLICAVLVALIGILEFFFKGNILYEYIIENPNYTYFSTLRPSGYRRAMSTLVHSAVLGTYLVVGLSFCFFFVEKARNLRKRLLYIGCMVIILLAFVLAFSRGSSLGFIAMSIVYFYKKRRFRAIALLLLAISLFVFFCSFTKTAPWQRFGIQGLTSPRLYYYKGTRLVMAFKMLFDYPIFGIGIDNIGILFAKYFPGDATRTSANITDWMHLAILAETGLFGFFTFIAFVVFLFRKAFYCYNRITDNIKKEIILALVCGLTGILVNMVTYDILYWFNPAFIFWMLCGMISAFIIKYS